MNAPLAGVRIIEVAHMLMGPYCGMLLADLGAEVVKIEPPTGDIGRTISPHSVGPHNAYFASLNRSKKSVVIDLASDAGQRALGELAASSRALVTNLRPSAIKKLGLTYEALQRWNPQIVCLALTGYGLESPFAERPAYDYVIQALTGVMQLTGEPGGPPTKTGYSAVDNSAGIMGATGLLAKLVEGKGGQVDIAMYDVMLSQMNYLAGAWLNAGERAARFPYSAHPYVVPAQIFRTTDGWISVFISHDEFWRRFSEEIGHPEWVGDPAFATMGARRENRARVLEAVAAVLATRSTGHWLDRLAPLGLVVAPVEDLEHALASEQTAAREMIADIATEHGSVRAVGNPVKVSGVAQRYGPPPRLGEHNAEFLRGSDS